MEETNNVTTNIEELTSSTGDTGYSDITSKESTSLSLKDSSIPESDSAVTFNAQRYNQSLAKMEENNKNQTTLTIKEFKALKRAKYDEIVKKFPLAYVLKNKRTGMVVQIQAVSYLHACNIIGWRQRHVKLIEIIDTKKEQSPEQVNEEQVTEQEITNFN